MSDYCEKHVGSINMTQVKYPKNLCPFCQCEQLREELTQTKAEIERLNKLIKQSCDEADFYCKGARGAKLMICYRDKTFCIAECYCKSCDRKLTKDIKTQAILVGMPLAVCDFSKSCKNYRSKNNANI